jgi:uncharacterized damage-inducible protein DinB
MALDLRDPYLAALAPRFEALEPRARAAIAGLSPAAMAQAPPHGGWSIAQVLEHLVVANSSYAAPTEAAITRGRQRAPRAHVGTFFGRLMLGAIAESNVSPKPAPRAYRPMAVREGVFEAFLKVLERQGEHLRQADGADLRTMLSSPILAIIRMNLGEALALGINHTERHLGQIERTRRSIGA